MEECADGRVGSCALSSTHVEELLLRLSHKGCYVVRVERDEPLDPDSGGDLSGGDLSDGQLSGGDLSGGELGTPEAGYRDLGGGTVSRRAGKRAIGGETVLYAGAAAA